MIYKAELVENGKVVRLFEEESTLDFDAWRYGVALDKLKPRGEEIRWYKNGERIYMQS